MRTIVYIDGFNLNYGSLKGSGHKWLDLFAFFQRTLPTNNKLFKVKYFTARVKPLSHDIDAPIRQDVYLRALKFLYPQQIEIIEGNFQIKKKKAQMSI